MSGVKFVFPLMCSVFPDLKELPRLEGFGVVLVGWVTCVTEKEDSFGGFDGTGTDEMELCVLGWGVKFGV